MRTMRFFGSAASLALIAGLAASPATADVFVEAQITKDKVVLVFEDTFKTKLVDIRAPIHLADIERGAESLALSNQLMTGNSTFGSGGHEATVENSVDANTGLVQFNNAAGYLNQQGNTTSAAVDGAGTLGTGGFADAQASTEQNLNFNFATPTNGGNVATTDNSITNNAGVVHGNNAAGDMNQQHNALSIAVAFSDAGDQALALAEADLGQFLIGNFVGVTDAVDFFGAGVAAPESAVISASIIGNTGIVGYNQAAGSMNQQGNSVAISATSAANAPVL